LSALRVLESAAGAAAAVWLCAGFTLAAWGLAWRACGPGHALLRATAAAAALLWLLTACFHLLTSAGLFSIGPACLVAGLLGAAAWREAGGCAGLATRLAVERRFVERVGQRHRGSPHRGVALAMLVCVAPALVRALILPPLAWDSLTYHALKAAKWVQTGGLVDLDAPGPWAYSRHTLAGAEVFLAWAMLPLRSDTLTGIVEIWQWLALGLVTMVLARRLGAREPHASSAAGFVLAIPTVRLMIGSGYVEMCGMLALVGGIVLGLATWNGQRPQALALSIAVLGVSGATKFSMLSIAGAAAAVIALRALWHGPAAVRRWAVAGGVAFLVAVGPWLVEATRRTGYPFSPVPLAIGGVVLGVAPPEIDFYLRRDLPDGFDLAAETAALRAVFPFLGSANESLGAFALVPLVAAVLGCGAVVGRLGAASLLVFAPLLIGLATYYAPSFAVLRLYWTWSSSRFLLPVVIVATVVSVAWWRESPHASGRYRQLLVALTLANLLFFSWHGFSPASVFATLATCAGLAVAGVAVASTWHRTRTVARAAAMAALMVAAVVSLHWWRLAWRHDLIGRDSVLHPLPQYWADAVPLIDRPGRHLRIAVTSGPHQNLDNWFTYPFLGGSFQNDVVYVPVSRDGRVRHVGAPDVTRELYATADFEAWYARLDERAVTHVLSFEPPSIEQEWMDGRADLFERETGVPQRWGLYRVASREGAARR
jgi:hypothetical protein